MKKRGFTLVELGAVVVIIVITSLPVFLVYDRFHKEVKRQAVPVSARLADLQTWDPERPNVEAEPGGKICRFWTEHQDYLGEASVDATLRYTEKRHTERLAKSPGKVKRRTVEYDREGSVTEPSTASPSSTGSVLAHHRYSICARRPPPPGLFYLSNSPSLLPNLILFSGVIFCLSFLRKGQD
ncbi:MAG: type II secretion system protein [Patescibacteria group bacterium]